MTPILTGSWAAASVAKPRATSAAPATSVRRVVLSMRESPEYYAFFDASKDWHAPPRSANPIALDRGRIELDAQPWSFGQQHMAGLEPERHLQQLRAQRIVTHVVFEHQRVRRIVGVRRGRQRSDEMAGRRQADRTTPDVRRYPQVLGMRQGGDALGFGESADGRDRRLHDVDAASVDQGAEGAHRVMRLAGGDRDRRAGAQFGVA